MNIYIIFYILYINVSWVDLCVFSGSYIKELFLVENDVSAYINGSGLGGINSLLISYLIPHEDPYL